MPLPWIDPIRLGSQPIRGNTVSCGGIEFKNPSILGGEIMNLKPNMGRVHRLLYAVIGAVLIGLPWVTVMASPWTWLLPAMGLVSLVSSAGGR